MNYHELQFKCGLEIHRQIETHKLFCHCPSQLKEGSADALITRRLHRSKGETQEIDTAVDYESKQNKTFVYHSYNECCCLVEQDEDPPQEVNQEALRVVLQVASLLQCKPVDELQVMRKMIIDGSNTSGFQRTMLVAYDGKLETSKGIVNINSICLEEDSARKIKEDNQQVHYNLDRLGIPLIEIATDASIQNPEHAKEVAETLGMILKSTGKVRSGIGTIRQDVNISIKMGNRVELKGFQELRVMPKVIEEEVKRQLKQPAKKEVRQVNPDGSSTFLRPMSGQARMYPETDVKPIPITKFLLESLEIIELISEKVLALEKEYQLSSVLAKEVLKRKLDLKQYVRQFPQLEPTFIARVFIEIPKDVESRLKLDSTKLRVEDFVEILTHLNQEEINKSAVTEMIREKLQTGKINYGAYKTVNTQDLEKEIREIMQKNKGATINAIMGIVMQKYRGKIEGKEVIELIKKLQ